MPVAVQQPQRKEEKDPLDIVLKGLSIANTIYGIKDAGVKAQLLADQRASDLKSKQQAAFIAGVEEIPVDDANPKGGFRYNAAKQAEMGRESAYKDAQTKKLIAEANAAPDNKALAQHIKELDVRLKVGQLKEQEKKQGEIEGPKALAATYGRRMEQADNIFNKLETEGYDRAGVGGTIGAMMPGMVKGNQAKQQAQAERNFVNAVLRRESGAAIAPSEFASAEEQYFKRAGDGPDVIVQKAQNRAQAIAGLKAEAGHAWDKVALAKTPQMNISEGKKNQLKQVLKADQQKPQTIMQNGHTYTLNPKTGQYE